MTGARDDSDPPTATELARLMAHDLRTPLNAVRGFADLLLTGAAGPLAASQAEFLVEIARAGRALESSVGLAQEVAEAPAPNAALDTTFDLADLLVESGFALAPAARSAARCLRLAGGAPRWRQLLAVCRTHMQGGLDIPGELSAAIEVRRQGCLELTMERTDINQRWQMSALREIRIRQIAAAVGLEVTSRPPHLPLSLRLRESGKSSVARAVGL